jgi:hypothetical protein
VDPALPEHPEPSKRSPRSAGEPPLSPTSRTADALLASLLDAIRPLIREEIREEVAKALASAQPGAAPADAREYVSPDEIFHIFGVGRTWFFQQLADRRSGLGEEIVRRPRGTTKRLLINVKEFREWFVRRGSTPGVRKRVAPRDRGRKT